MGHTCTRHEEGIVWVVEGVFSPDVGFRLNEELAMQPSLDRIQYFIIDLSDIAGFDSESDQTEVNAHYSHSLSIYSRTMIGVFIISDPAFKNFPDPYIEAMQKAGSEWDLGVCASYAEAKALIESKLNRPIA